MNGTVGGISIHVVDVSRGVVAAGMRIDVFAAGTDRRPLCSGRVNPKGMLDDPVLMSEAMQPGAVGFLIVFAGTMLPMLVMLAWLHLRKGVSGPNRYGPEPDATGFSRTPARHREGMAAIASI